ncbi:hypothetical protein F9B85_12835 [Heliorestis acidaminivorans]|uniref:Uncharacterized protein n=1 Tax=Heliorestis acidaminivorans TaxID=553427 RepID=A0A6I0EZC8_9FIRM|nr:hypothetical protein [Heliorestis acidaminivorans]KAB2951249.1 hypothetical protein F9B85_12835 [Heliorestis acidaminivorans]
MHIPEKIINKNKEAPWTSIVPVFIFIFWITFTLTYLGVLAYDRLGNSSFDDNTKYSTQELLDRPIAPGVAIYMKTTYSLSQETVVEALERPYDWTGRPFRELLQRFPDREGWQYELKPGQIIFQRTLSTLSPQDATKRHLGIVEGVIAIIIGPPGIYGGVDRLTTIEAQYLPEALRRVAESGWLAWSDEEVLYQILDGMDESNRHYEQDSYDARRIYNDEAF